MDYQVHAELEELRREIGGIASSVSVLQDKQDTLRRRSGNINADNIRARLDNLEERVCGVEDNMSTMNRKLTQTTLAIDKLAGMIETIALGDE